MMMITIIIYIAPLHKGPKALYSVRKIENLSQNKFIKHRSSNMSYFRPILLNFVNVETSV